MPRRVTNTTKSKKVPLSNATHLISQTNDGLIIGTRQQIESSGKENFNSAVNKNLMRSRKCIGETISCRGTVFFSVGMHHNNADISFFLFDYRIILSFSYRNLN